MKSYTFSVFIFLFVSFSAYAASPIKISPITSPVVDEVGVLDARSAEKIRNVLFQVNEAGSAQVQVYIIKSLNGLTIEEVSIDIADQIKLGTAKKDNGILFLIAPNDRRMRIEVGQGLEGDLPDVQAKRIIADVVTPAFRQKEYSEGIVAGVNQIISFVAPQFYDGSGPEPRKHSFLRNKIDLIALIILFILFPFLNLFRRGFGGRSWGGGYGGGYGGGGGGFGSSGGGGGWSGGGGGFSGGGSSGSW